jgi:hypothetical protein
MLIVSAVVADRVVDAEVESASSRGQCARGDRRARWRRPKDSKSIDLRGQSSAKPRILLLRRKKQWTPSIHPVLGLAQRDCDLRDMTVLSYGAVAWERNSGRDGQLLLTRQDVFPGKGQ